MPTSKIQQVLDAQRAALLRGDVATLARYAAQWQQVEAALADKAELLAHELAQMEADGEIISEARLYQLARYQAFIQQARAEIDRYAQQLAPDVSEQQAALAAQGTQDAVAQIAAITGSFLQLPSAATNVAIGYAADGSPLINLLRATWPDAVASMTQALITGVAAGYNPRKTARMMQEASGASLNRMLTVARTEQLRAYRESSRDIYQKAGVKQYKRLAAKNARTCFLCLADDGHIYQVSEPLPIHPNCRCSSVPLVDGYKVDTGQTGAEWFAQQDTETQQQILGAGRFAQYQQGTPLSAFTHVAHDDTWGATLRARGVNKTTNRVPQYEPPLYEIQRKGNTWRVGEHEITVTGGGKKSWDLQQVGTVDGKPLQFNGLGWSNMTKSEINQYVDTVVAPALARIPKAHLGNLTGITITRWRDASVLGESGGNEQGGFATFSVIGEKGIQLAAPPQALIHELGHVRSYALTREQAERWARATGFNAEIDDYRKLFWRPYDYMHLYRNGIGPTDYGKQSPTEAWAETYRILHSRELERDKMGVTWHDDKYASDRDILLDLMREILGE